MLQRDRVRYHLRKTTIALVLHKPTLVIEVYRRPHFFHIDEHT
jgi:hypothetical protein